MALSNLIVEKLEQYGGIELKREHQQYFSKGLGISIGLHMLQAFLYGAYKPPREAMWMVGVLLFLLVMTFAFTGYLLPWDQTAYWATQIGINMVGTVPVVGDFMMRVMRGGEVLGALTLRLAESLAVTSVTSPEMGRLLFLRIRNQNSLLATDTWRGSKYGLSLTQVQNALAASNASIPGGSVTQGPKQFELEVTGLFARPEDLARAPSIEAVKPSLLAFVGRAPLIAHTVSADVGRLFKEGRRDEATETRVLVALGAEDVDLLAREELLVGDAHQFGDASRGVVPPLVAQDAERVVVVPHRVPEGIAGEPLVAGEVGGLVGAAAFDERQIERGGGDGHVTNLGRSAGGRRIGRPWFSRVRRAARRTACRPSPKTASSDLCARIFSRRGVPRLARCRHRTARGPNTSSPR